ncbi:segregation/condensation protein A [Clostridium neuense]|uniref:Segregation and condensation protein A n=1 Tax=Clostridium neuense TaxID=1728934 RepID=A0ABW8THA0_9CLOT
MTLNININNFQGPFDLLLHLIKKNEMDIYDIKIHEITNQYMEYLNEMKEIDLEVTSEFIVIAATLIEIKSKFLLPKSKDEEEEEKDPREELVSKLLEYKKFKSVASYLRQKQEESGIVFSKKPEIIEDKEDNNRDILKGITMLQLYNLFCKLMNDYDNKLNHNNVYLSEISVDEYKVEDKMEDLLNGVKHKKILHFSEIIKGCHNKLEMVVTFMALLELVKLRSIKIHQESNFKDIFMERIEGYEEN